MKKISLIAILILAGLLLQECKKDSYTAYALSTYSLVAVVNDSTWTTDTVNSTMVFNAAAKTKTFALTGTAKNIRISFSVVQNTSVNTAGFPLSTYTVGSSSGLTMAFLLNQKNSSGVYTYTPQGTILPGSGTVTISAIDSVKKIITGSFSLFTNQNNYDSNGNVVSVTINKVQAGGFNNLPYTFTSN